jgi:ketosteroid isomerase-like protein
MMNPNLPSLRTLPSSRNASAPFRSLATLQTAFALALCAGLCVSHALAKEAPPKAAPSARAETVFATPEAVVHAFAERFNAGQSERLMALYGSNAVFVSGPGKSEATPEGIRLALEPLLGMRVPLQITPRHVYQTGNTALVVSDWTIRGKNPAGEDVDLAGTATDVLQRTPSGGWRYLIDNPFGVQRP